MCHQVGIVISILQIRELGLREVMQLVLSHTARAGIRQEAVRPKWQVVLRLRALICSLRKGRGGLPGALTEPGAEERVTYIEHTH